MFYREARATTCGPDYVGESNPTHSLLYCFFKPYSRGKVLPCVEAFSVKNPYLYMIIKKYETTLYIDLAQIESLIRSIRSISCFVKGG